MKKIYLSMLYIASSLGIVHAQAQITETELFAIPSIGSPVLSPLGDKLVYTLSKTDLQNNSSSNTIILYDVKSGTKENVLQQASDPQWSPDGTKLAFRSSLNKISGIYYITLNDRTPKLVAQVFNSNHFLGHSAIKNYSWSPDSKMIAFVSADTSSAETVNPNSPKIINRILYKSRTAFSDNLITKIYLATLGSSSVKLLTNDAYDSHSLTWSPDSKQIAFISNHTADPDNNYNNDLFAVDIQSLKVNQLTNTPGTEHNPDWSPDGKYIIYPATIRQWNTKDSSPEDMKLYAYEVKTGAITCITTDLDERLDGAKWAEDSKSFYFSFPKNGKRVLYRGTLNGVFTPIIDKEAIVGRPSVAGTKMAFTLSTPTQPNEIFIYNLTNKSFTQVTTDASDFLKNKTLSKNESFWFTSHDGVKVQGFISYPSHTLEKASTPVIHRIHGGPHGAFGYGFTDINELLVAKGYAVISINPRGSSGYGQKFTDGTYQAWGGGDYLDLMKGIDYALEKYPFLNADKMGVTGGSYGGFMTNWVVTQTNRYKAAVTSASVSNLISFYGTSIYPDLIETEFNGLPWNNYALLWHFSPMAHIQNVKTPTLLIHGENDMDVPITQAEEFFIGLKKLGVPTQLVRYPNEGHGFSQPKNRFHNNQQLLAWFDKYLK